MLPTAPEMGARRIEGPVERCQIGVRPADIALLELGDPGFDTGDQELRNGAVGWG